MFEFSYLAIIIIIVITLIFYIVFKLTFWKRQKIATNVFHFINLFNYPIHIADKKLVDKYGKIVGFYELLSPAILITEPKLIKKILNANISDFFQHRSYIFPEQTGGQSLLFLNYNVWKIKRSIISPAFKTKNLKNLVHIFDNAVDSLVNALNQLPDNQIFNIEPYYQTFMFDIILRSFFATKIDSIDYTNNPMIKHFHQILGRDFSLKQLIGIMCPKIAKLFDIEMIDRNAIQFLGDLSEKLINERKNNNVIKDDCIQYLIDSLSENPNKNDDKSLTKKEIIDNCILFLIAGIDTSVSTLNHLTYEISVNPQIQQKLFQEINDFNINNELTADSIKTLSYLDLCIKESLRLWPPGSRLERKCENDIHFENIFIPKDSLVIIPVYALQRHPDHFENPESFIPERFLPQNMDKIKSGSYIPFGDGPRLCVANRFAEIVLKLCLIKLVQNFEFVECNNTNPINYYKCQPFINMESLNIQLNKR